MSWIQALNFFDTIRPIYLANKIFHIHFETLDFKQQTAHRTLLDQFRFVVTVLFDIYRIYRGLEETLPYLQLTDSVLLNIGGYTSLVSLILFSSTLVLRTRYKSGGIIEIYSNVANCDRQLQSLGIVIDHRKDYLVNLLFVLATIASSVIIVTVVLVIHYDESWIKIASIPLDFVTILATYRTIICFTLFSCYNNLMLLTLKKRFDRVREAMVRQLDRETAGVPRSNYEVCNSVRCIASVHDQLSNAIQLFNECFATSAMVVLVTLAFFSVFVVFGLIHAYASSADEGTIRMALINVLFDVFYVLTIVPMVAYASHVSSDCKQISIMIHKVICYGTFERRIVKELGTFSQQLNHHAPEISCGFFDFNWTLFYSIVGTFVTYLVILLQFDVENLNRGREL